MRKLLNALTMVPVVLALVDLPSSAAEVTSKELLEAQSNAGEWLMYGRNYLNQRFSPLDKITKDNVAQLKPVFAYSTG
jgi:glucose dehydrogenase